MGKKEIMRKESSSRMEGERPTIVSPIAAPEVMEATGAPHAEATPSPPRREETRPPVVPSTSGGQAPATGTTQTPTIPMDALEMFVKSLRPDLDLSQALASLTAELPSSNPTQLTPSQPISQPSHIEIPIAENEEGGDEWFDAVAGIEAPMGEKGEEEVYSGATEVLSEGVLTLDRSTLEMRW